VVGLDKQQWGWLSGDMTDREIDSSTENYSAQRCPVCNGFGTVSNKRIECHGCQGRGFVVIDKTTGLPVEKRKRDANKNNPH